MGDESMDAITTQDFSDCDFRVCETLGFLVGVAGSREGVRVCMGAEWGNGKEEG